MKVSYNWLQSHFDTSLPSPEEIAELLTFHAFEVEGIEQVENDSVIDVDVLPNRAHDCLNHLGIARELSVLLKTSLKRDTLREEKKDLPKSSSLTLAIDDQVNAPRHMAALIRGVEVKESPEWLRQYLEAIGQRSINNIVDATNYVMLNLGQPTHAFDASKLVEKDGNIGITIRSAKEGEKITLLGGDESYELSAGMLVLADSHSDVALDIAGTKGGVPAELTSETTSVVLSAAHFKGASIRKTSQLLKLRTDASTRFENSLSPELPYYGITELVTLVLELASGELEGYVDVYPFPQKNTYKTGVSTYEINRLLGTTIVDRDVEDILGRFGFSYQVVQPLPVVVENVRQCLGGAYQYGASVLYDAPEKFDCSSLVSYVYSRAGVSIPRMAVDQYVFGSEVSEGDIKPGDVVFARNGTDTKPLTFTLRESNKEVTHEHPMRETQEFMPGTPVKESVSHCGIYIGDGKVIHASQEKGEVVEELLSESAHFKHIIGYRRMVDTGERYSVEVPFERLDIRIKEDLIEEVGRVYGYKNIKPDTGTQKDITVEINKEFYYAEKIRNMLTEQGFTEVYTYSLRDSGEVAMENPIASDKGYMRSTLVDGLTESLVVNEKNAPVLGLQSVRVFEIGHVFSKDTERLSLGVAASDKKDVEEVVAHLSSEVGDLSGAWNDSVFTCDLNAEIETLPEPEAYDTMSDNKAFVYQPFSIYPFALRDIAVWVPESLSAQDIEGMIAKEAGELLVRTTLFDEYKKDGRISYAFRLVFQSPERTLAEEDISGAMEHVTHALNAQDGFDVR